jgi:8-oxo-dGTP pyrophosphatase MutT (NUDIX family)
MSKQEPRVQYAALPYRVVEGRPEVLLITSRETRRWIIPKGWAEKGIKARDMAAREALEEAGVQGKVQKSPYGSYHYEKRLTTHKTVECKVTVFLLKVEQELEDWPEKGERERCWLTPSRAALAISESGLVAMLLRLGLSPA